MEGNHLVSFQRKSQDPHFLVFKFKPVVPWIESKWVSALEHFRWDDIRWEDGQAFSDLSDESSGAEANEQKRLGRLAVLHALIIVPSWKSELSLPPRRVIALRTCGDKG
jgi:hypothetical protein